MPGVTRSRTAAALLLIFGFAANAHAQIRLDLPVQPLSQSLTAVGTLGHLNVMFDPSVVDGLKAPALKAELSADDALGRLLVGTILHAVRVDANTIRVVAGPSLQHTASGRAPEADSGYSPTNMRVADAGGPEAAKELVQGNGRREEEPALGTGAASETRISSRVKTVDEVVVTGSRLPAKNQEGPQEVKSYSRDQIENGGQTTITDFLNTLPDVSVGMTENGLQSQTGATTVSLHGMPIGTTLVLINGRRTESSPSQKDFGVFFDLNNIPLAAVERVDVISEGSSAVYGSDAIAGVVNILLKNNFNGLDFSVSYGGASGTDETNLAALAGKQWDRGSVSLIASYQDRSALQGADRPSIINGVDPANAAGAGALYSGLVRYSCSIGNVYFPNGYSLDGGSTSVGYAAVPKNSAPPTSVQSFAATAGALNSCNNGRFASYDFIPQTHRLGAFASANFSVNESTELFAELMLSKVNQDQSNGPALIYLGSPQVPIYSVSASNPYNPFGETVAVSGFASAAGNTLFRLTTDFDRPLIGVRGTLLDNWNWEVAGWQSRDRSQFTTTNSQNFGAVFAALNSSDPATALDPFVATPNGSPALLNSLLYPEFLTRYTSKTTALNGFLRGSLFDLPAGAVDLVVGSEYDVDNIGIAVVSAPNAPDTQGRTSYSRHYSSIFGETRIPILPSRSGFHADSLSVTAAARYDHYDDFGSKTAPQFGVEARPIDSLLVRATYGKAFKAPSLYALYAPVTTSPGTIFADPMHGGALVSNVDVVSGGNRNLQPETGQSRSVGVVYESRNAPELKVSLTYWNIDENQSVQSLDALTILDNESSFPGRVIRNQSGQLVAIDAGYANYGGLNVKGFDFSAIYTIHSRVGDFAPAIAATDTYHYTTSFVPGAPSGNRVSVASDDSLFAPRWKGNIALTWKWHSLSANAAGRWTGPYQDYDSTREVGNFWLCDFNLKYALGRVFGLKHERTVLSIGAVNIFNRLPQDSNYLAGEVGYDPTQADLRGRFVYGRVDLKL